MVEGDIEAKIESVVAKLFKGKVPDKAEVKEDDLRRAVDSFEF